MPVAAASTRVFAAFLLIVLSGFAALAQGLPALSGRVVDTAGILSADTEAQLTALLADHERQSSDQVVVVTIDSTDGESIESYANRLFRHWGLGQAEENNGVLLLVAVDDRKLRIEVGYGLEGTLTDLLAKLIIDETIVPRFRSGDYEDGIRRGVGDVIAVLTGDPAELQSRAQRSAERSDPLEEVWVMVIVFLIIAGGMFAVTWLGPHTERKIGSGRRVTFGGSSGGFSGGGGSSGGGGASGGW